MPDRSGHARLVHVLSQYQERQDDYQLLAGYLQKRLTDLALSLGIYPIVMGRAKSLESFAEKMQRAGKHYDDPLREMTDLCGVRVITHTLDQVATLAAKVGEEFLVDPLNSEDKQEKLSYREFGYLSNHLIIQLKEIPTIPECPEETCRRLRDLKAELQLRTLAQHLWADIYHELGYKNEFQLPGRWEREFARLAALLGNCDKGFQDIKTAMEVYQSSYGSYMTQEQLRALAERLEALLAVDTGNTYAMHRLIRTYLALEGADDKLRTTLARFGDQLQAYAPALRDIGVGITQIHRRQADSPEFTRGQEFLRRAVTLDSRDVDAWCSLGGTYRKQRDQANAQGRHSRARKCQAEVLRCYREAYYLDPTNPYPLGNYIAELLLEDGNTKAVALFRPQVQAAAERCRKQVEVRVNLPWALFDLGLFHLYLGDPCAALCAYAKGIEVAPKAWMVQSAAKTIDNFRRRKISLDGLDWLDTLLRIGSWMRATPGERPALRGPGPQEGVKFIHPVLILAGGCDGLDDAARAQLDVLRSHLEGIGGTVVGGGTRSGIAGIPGDLQERRSGEGAKKKMARGKLQTLGYLPAKGAKVLTGLIDRRYSHHCHTNGKEFSPLEPLAFWEDFLGSGGDPASVKLLGFNGEQIAACEFRIALAFGARVGIIAGSGREADMLLVDSLWKDHPRLRPLSLAGDDVKDFVNR